MKKAGLLLVVTFRMYFIKIKESVMDKGIVSQAVLILYLCMTANVFANTEDAFSEVKFSIGPGLLTADKPQKGADTEIFPLPIIFCEKGNFYFKVNKGGYKLFESSFTENDEYSIDIIAKYRPDGYESSDDFMLNGMSDRDPTIDWGFSWAYTNNKIGDIEVNYLMDMMDNHNGKELDVHYSVPMSFNKCHFAPGIGLKWLSGNLTNYYYGVGSNEVRGDRPRYVPGETTNLYMDVSVFYPLNEDWSLFSLLTYEWLGDEIKDSPIVNEDGIVTFFAGLIYSF